MFAWVKGRAAGYPQRIADGDGLRQCNGWVPAAAAPKPCSEAAQEMAV